MSQVILFSDIYRPFHGKGMGVYRLANHIRSAGYSVKVIHAFINLKDQDFYDICKEHISEHTLLVGLGATVMANLEQNLFFGMPTDIVKDRFLTLKETYPQIATCLGGAQVTGSTDEYLTTFNFFDYAIKGQGETAIVELLNHLSQKTKIKTITITRPKIISDKLYPFGDFNQTVNTYTAEDCIQFGEALPIELARGCIFKCKFCGYDLIGKKLGDFVKPADLIRQELLHNYENWGVTDYYVADETINDSEEKVEMLLESVQGLPFKPSFGGFLRLDLIWKFPEMAQKLLDWGLEACSFGIETINDASGRAVGKGLGKDRIESTLRHIKNVWGDRVFVNASFILGLKHDNPATAPELDRWLEQMYAEKLLHTVFVKPLYIMPKIGLSVLDKEFEDHGYSIMTDIDIKLTSDRTRTVVEDDCIAWETPNYNYIQASHDAEIIHKKYNNRKILKGKIGKHNYAFVKSLLPKEQHRDLMLSQIYDVPFSNLSKEETEEYITRLEQEHNSRYINMIKTKH